jgi:hypothetical protein
MKGQGKDLKKGNSNRLRSAPYLGSGTISILSKDINFKGALNVTNQITTSTIILSTINIIDATTNTYTSLHLNNNYLYLNDDIIRAKIEKNIITDTIQINSTTTSTIKSLVSISDNYIINNKFNKFDINVSS